MNEEQKNKMNHNAKILGYYVDKEVDGVFLEVELQNIPKADDIIVTIGLGRPLLIWMLAQLDLEEEEDEANERKREFEGSVVL